MSLLTINNLNLQFNNQIIIKNFSLKLDGGITTIVGPSGCGKSTLFKAIINGNKNIITTSDIAYMDQQNLMFSWLTVEQNFELINKFTSTRIDIDALLTKYHLNEYKKMFPTQLSGGTSQRLNLLRSFIMPGDLMLLDEPFNQIDEFNRKQYYDFLLSLSKEFHKSILMTTHNIDEAVLLSDQIICVSSKPMQIKVTFEKPFRRDEIYKTLALNS